MNRTMIAATIGTIADAGRASGRASLLQDTFRPVGIQVDWYLQETSKPAA